MLQPLGVAPCPPPQSEGTITLPDGRRLGYAEFGHPQGPLVLWFHGSPGARRQVPLTGRQAAEALGLRLVCVERPGVGSSTDHCYAAVRDWAHDIAVVADRLGHDRFMVVGLSGGGPYALACAHELPDRIAAVALLGSVVPTTDEEETAEGMVALTRQWSETLRLVRSPLAFGLSRFVQVATPVARPALQAFAHLLPAGDRRVLADPDVQSMFLDDLVLGTTRQCRGVLNDFLLFGRSWGFRLADIDVPVHWWHGDADPFVPIEEAYRAATLLPDVEFVVRQGESHLGEFAAAEQVLTTLNRAWNLASRGGGTIVPMAPRLTESGPAAIP